MLIKANARTLSSQVMAKASTQSPLLTEGATQGHNVFLSALIRSVDISAAME